MPEPNLLAALAIRLATDPAERLAFAGDVAFEVLRAAGLAAALRVTFTLVVVAFLAVVFLVAAFFTGFLFAIIFFDFALEGVFLDPLDFFELTCFFFAIS